jgi:uracil-DNA glycosylase
MLARLRLDPRAVPASNVIFARSRGEADLRDRKSDLLDACWPIHEAVIAALDVRALVCFGGTAGAWVRERLHAHRRVDTFQENNGRKWTSQAHRARMAESSSPSPIRDEPTGVIRRPIRAT